MALVTSSINARPVVMAGVIGGITDVESTLPAIRAPSTVFPHPAGSAGTLAAVMALVNAEPAIVADVSAPETRLAATEPAQALVSAGIWAWANSPLMIFVASKPGMTEARIDDRMLVPPNSF